MLLGSVPPGWGWRLQGKPSSRSGAQPGTGHARVPDGSRRFLGQGLSSADRRGGLGVPHLPVGGVFRSIASSWAVAGLGPAGASPWPVCPELGGPWGPSIRWVLGSDWRLSPQAYNIHVNGVLHCRVRYSQLLGLHEQVGSRPQRRWELLPTGPPLPRGSAAVPTVLLAGRVLGPAGCRWVLQEGTACC